MTVAAGRRRVVRGAAAALVLLAAPLAGRAADVSLDRSPALYGPHEQPRLHYETAGGAALTVQDWRGRALHRLMLPAGGTSVALPPLPVGYYEVVVGNDTDQQRRALAVLEPPLRPSHTFGVMTHFAQGWQIDIVPSIARAGIGTVRDEQYWAQLEPRAGEYASPPGYTRYMAALQQAAIEPLLVLSFANPNYDSGKTPFTPAGRAAFAAYGAELLRRYGGQVHAVEVWNEINGTFCTGLCPLDRAGTYAPLLADSYVALKAVAPGVTVVGGAAVKVPMPWFDALLARGAARHWDAVAVHPYRSDPEGAQREIAALQQRLRAAGSEAPIWATEFGSGAGRSGAADRRATAAYLVRMAVVLRGVGVERMYWYLLRDYAEFQGMGLLRADADALGRYAPTPAYAAYAALIRLLDGADRIAREPTDPRTHVYRFERQGETTYVLWAPDGPVPATLDLPAGGRLIDLVGGTKSLPAGVSTLELDAYPQYLQGTVRRLDAARPDTLLADASADFDVDSSAGPWAYGAYRMSSPAQAPGVCPPPAGAPLALQKRSSAWEYFYGDPRWPVLRVGADTLHPARSEDGAVWAVRSYRSDGAGTLRVSGAFSRNGQGDGAGACILLDGRAVFEAQLPRGANRRSEFDLHLQVLAGARLDFVVTPGPGLDITDDAVGLQARISRPQAAP